MNELLSKTIDEISRLIANKEVSPVEVTRACLEHITSIEPSINSFITLTGELALKQAHTAEQEILKNNLYKPLHGVPIAVKDLFETQGIRTTAGSFFLRNHLPAEDCTVVKKLRKSGAILLGKLNMHEWALGVTNENPFYGNCHNPWDTNRVTGGSSGGSAAALAAMMCYGALGSDTGGSIRIPSSLCGTVGLKPTFGRVSKQGVVPLSWNLDHVGPMGRSVKDLAILLNVIAGYDQQDPYSVDVPPDNFLNNIERGIKGWRVAIPTNTYFQEADEEVLKAFKDAVHTFKDLGATIMETEIFQARQIGRANGLMTISDAAAYHRERMASHANWFGEDVLDRLQTGAATTSTDYILARQTQNSAKRWFHEFFSKHALLLTPTTPFTAAPIGSRNPAERAKQYTKFTGLFNLTGLPALSIPCGFSSEGLPIGLQIVSGQWQEAAVLRAAFAFEQATSWHTHHPSLFK